MPEHPHPLLAVCTRLDAMRIEWHRHYDATSDDEAIGEQHRPDLGVIDLRLREGEYGTAIAAALCRRGDFGILYVTAIQATQCSLVRQVWAGSRSRIPAGPSLRRCRLSVRRWRSCPSHQRSPEALAR
jgi:hypothetical protein